jgi:hypothetical protein
MFGSKNLLLAYGLGVFGLALTSGALGGTLEWPQLLLFMFGLLVIWTSALFGPIMYFLERDRTRADEAAREGTSSPRAISRSES